MASNHGHRSSRAVGLLFASAKTYESRVWDAAYAEAIERGMKPADAIAHADAALAAAKRESADAPAADAPEEEASE